jgi:peroxiredoxin Q/BCP
MIRLTAFLALTTAAMLIGGAQADDPKVGDKAPTFQATNDQGKEWKSTEHVGKQIVVVYFYPADFTGGCTKQACGFRDDYSKLADKGAIVVGISGDSAKTHKLFKEHHKLPYTLLADEEGALAKLFGVPVGKGGEVTVKELDNLKIKQGVRAKRWTFVIDKGGKIAYKDENVNAAEDSKKILDLVEKLNK